METIKTNFVGIALIVIDLSIIFSNIYQLVNAIH
jgi:hypothetical protein